MFHTLGDKDQTGFGDDAFFMFHPELDFFPQVNVSGANLNINRNNPIMLYGITAYFHPERR